MRDLAITALVALLIVFAGIRFSGYQRKITPAGVQDTASVSSSVNATSTATSTIPVGKAGVSGLPDKEPVIGIGGGTAASIQVADQKAGDSVMVTSLFVPEDSYWVAVREDEGGVSRTLGARLFGKGKGSGVIELLRPTVAGKTYTVVFHKDNGDRQYTRALDLEVQDASGKAVGVPFKAL